MQSIMLQLKKKRIKGTGGQQRTEAPCIRRQPKAVETKVHFKTNLRKQEKDYENSRLR